MSLERFFQDRAEIAEKLEEIGDLSLVNTFNTDLPRVFIVAAASSFEVDVTRHIVEFFDEVSSHASASEFIIRKALFRSYHQLFDWKTSSVKSFTQLFGTSCSAHYKELLDEHDWMQKSAAEFLRIGNARNELVHGDFSTHSPSMTAMEVRSSYSEATRFVDAIPHIIRLVDIPTIAP